MYTFFMKELKSCSVDGCSKRLEARGLCGTHYMRLKRTGVVGEASLKINMGFKGCSIPECSGTHIAKTLCQKHYTIYDTYGLSIEQIALLPRKCEFCSSQEKLEIDHDHACCPGKKKLCGKCVRRVLCKNCNIAIGHLGDNPEIYRVILESLIDNPNPRLFK